MQKKGMRLMVHFAIALPSVAVILYLTQNWLNAALFLGMAFAIDIDHYLLFLSEGRGFSLSKAHAYYDGFVARVKRGENPGKQLMVFHTVEFAVLLAALCMAVSNYYLLAGLALHQATDMLGDRYVRTTPNLRRKSILVKRW